MEYSEVVAKLRSLSSPKNVQGMARFGINPQNTLGVNIPALRSLAKSIGKNHRLAQRFWDSGIHEAKILASMIDESAKVTDKQMEKWVAQFDSWDVCDQICMNLFGKTSVAFEKARQWARQEKEFTRRAGFALMAVLAWHDKVSADEKFIEFLPLIKKYSTDERNFVKKAVNWALRQIGKRNLNLNKKAIVVACEIQEIDSKAAKWIAVDAIRELESVAVRKRL